MNTVLKNIVAHTYKPLLVKYLSKTRTYRYKDIRMSIPPEVFHPGFFFSTQLLLQHINRIDVNQKQFLELGCGSGLIAMVAAKKNAIVTATDINTIAIEALKKNCVQNNVTIKVITSDLFLNVPPQQFDIIAINPPYYKKQPVNAKDHAWLCGENGEYFASLFATLAGYIHADSEVLMILFDGCDMEMIYAMAAKNNFKLTCVYRKKNMLEENIIYKVEKI
ncbi:class I SAM-dependent methyltransferase [Ferruginibacter profundus]